MDVEEYTAWSNFMKSCRGIWTIDPIHNGEKRDLIAFLPDVDDETRGSFITASASTLTAGRYEAAYPALTDGIFVTLWGMSYLGGDTNTQHGCAKPTEYALKAVLHRIVHNVKLVQIKRTAHCVGCGELLLIGTMAWSCLDNPVSGNYVECDECRYEGGKEQ